MSRFTLFIALFVLSASVFGGERVASITCAVISETTLNQSAYRVKEVNEARSKLNLDPYLEGDDEILQAIKLNLCNLLIMDYDEYKKESELLIRAEEKEIERKYEEQRKKREEERKKMEEERQRKKKQLEERQRAIKVEEEAKRAEEKNKILQKITEDQKKLREAFENCDLPNQSTKISISKNKVDLSLSVFLDFSKSVKESCPSLISGRQEIQSEKRPLTQKTKDKLTDVPIMRFWYLVKIDGFAEPLILNTSYTNYIPTFNIDRFKQEKTLFSGAKPKIWSVGVDGSNRNGEDPYARKRKSDNGKYKNVKRAYLLEPFFADKKDLKKVKVKMIKEVSLVEIRHQPRTSYGEIVSSDIPTFKKVIYTREN